MSVVRSVTGELAAKGLQELDVSWLWEFEDGEKKPPSGMNRIQASAIKPPTAMPIP